MSSQGPDADADALDDLVARALVQRELPGRDPDEVLRELEPRRGPERILDLFLRSGAHDLTLADLEASPHGVDRPRLPELLRTSSGKVELAPEPIVRDLKRLRASLAGRNGSMVLIGRRQLRSNNSWMHNLNALVKGKDRCTMHLSREDAERLGLADGDRALVRSATGELEAPVEVTDAIMPGVVSIPHGWGHDVAGVRMRVAAEHPGVNSNLLADDSLIDPLSGNAC